MDSEQNQSVKYVRGQPVVWGTLWGCLLPAAPSHLPAPCRAPGSGLPLTGGLSLFSVPCSVEGEAPSSETGTSLDSPSAYHQGSLAPASSLSPDRYEHASVGAYGLYSGPPGQQQRTRRPKLQHSTSILRKQAEEEAIKRSRSLSESYELSSDLQDKQVGGACLGNRWQPGGSGWRRVPRPLLGQPEAAGSSAFPQIDVHSGALVL